MFFIIRFLTVYKYPKELDLPDVETWADLPNAAWDGAIKLYHEKLVKSFFFGSNGKQSRGGLR
jgi:hypothetical protein